MKKTEPFEKPEKPVDNPQNTNRCFVGNLSFDIDEDSLFKAFKDVDINCDNVNWVTDRETGKFYGTSFVTFETPEDAAWAVAVSNAHYHILERKVKVEFCPHRNKRAPSAIKARAEQPPSQRPDKGSRTAFFGNLPFEIDDDTFYKWCADCGEVKTVRWLEDIKTGAFKGAGFADFYDTETVDKLVKTKNGTELLGRKVRVDYA
mmetsp:Transcript_9855/g.18555  ORF Transcript_9855/g.18555 Transcript_9855/m.18555 type:complete len:204 (+) Transcript_9855:2-613(+)